MRAWKRRGLRRAWAGASRFCTLSEATVAHMPCNPAVGGTAKGHLVREIDALGGLMGLAIDATAIQFKLLNRSRGPAVWSPRAQADKRRYSDWVHRALRAEPNIEWIIGRAGRIEVDSGGVSGLALESGELYRCRSLVVTTGTFLNGLVHVGREQRPSGRAGEPPSRDLAESIKSIGFTWGRLKTGTPPRLDRRSIDFSAFAAERGDEPPVPFSFTTERIERDQIECYLLHTNDRVHELVRDHIGESPLFNGQISGIGPRYCPSLEDKVMRFAHRDRHQLFLEPEGLDVDEIYINGFSMSLPAELQEQLVHALPGLEAAVVMRPGYAVEYRFRATDRIEADARNKEARRAISRGSDQRDLRLRRGRSPGSRGRNQCGAGRRRVRSVRPVENDELHRHDDRRPDHQGMPRAISHVHVARRASAASEDR